MLAQIPLPNSARQRRQLAGQRLRHGRLLELLAARRREHHRQLEGVRALRPVQGQPLSGEPDRRRLLPAVRQQPLRHEHRRRLGVGDVEQDDAERARQLLQHDRRVLQPVAAARRRRPAATTGRATWYSSLYNSGYVYYPALDVTSGTRHGDTTNRLGRQGREWYPASRCVDGVGAHEPLPGPPQHEVGRRGARLLRRGGALRADQPGVQLDADRQQLRHARTSSTPATSGRRSCSARSTTRRRRGSCRCRSRTCAATPPTSRTTSTSAIG